MQVPYNPIASERPASSGTPGYSVSVSANAFGAQAAEAQESAAKMVGHADAALYGQISELGKEFGKTGSEMWERAVALQQLRNDTEARDAESNYMLEAGRLHADFNALQGKAAVDAFPKYMEELKAAREKIRGTLSNDDSRRRYDGPSSTLLSRSIFNGAGHAATANKQWQMSSAKSEMELDAKSVEDDPQDERLFQDKLLRTQGNASQISILQGNEPDSPQAKELGLKAKSALWSQRIIGLSRTAPFEAAQMLEANKTSMTQADFLKVDNSVRSQSRAVGARNIANDIFNANLDDEGNPTKTRTQLEKEVEAKAKELDPKDPVLAHHAVAALNGKFNQDRYAKQQERLTNHQIVAGAIEKGVTDVSQLRQHPRVAAAIDALPETDRLKIPGQINRYNAARDKVSNQENYVRLWGLSNNDVEGFLNTDITAEKLSQEDMRKLMEKQRKLKEVPNSDPRVGRAVGQIRAAYGPQLEQLGIYKRDTRNKDDYDRFVGSVQQAIDVWTQENKKPPSYKDITETIAPQIIKEITEPGSWWGSNKVPFYNRTVPSAFATKLKADAVAAGDKEPDDIEVRRVYNRIEFMKLFGKAGAKGDKIK